MKRPLRLFWFLLLPLATCIGLTVSVANWLATEHLSRYSMDLEAANLETEAHLALFRIADLLPRDLDKLRQVCQEMALQSERRVTIVLQGGEVACDSETSRTRFGPPGNPEEITTAFAGGVGRAKRSSRTLGRTYLYAAVPLRRGAQVDAVVRIGIPLAAVEGGLRTIRLQMFATGAVLVLLGAAASYLLTRALARPLEQLRHAVHRFAAGDFSTPLPAPYMIEAAVIGNTLRSMAMQLKARLETLEEQRGLQQAILAGMAEGVLAVDTDGRLLLINRAAARMLRIPKDVAAGTPLKNLQDAAPILDFTTRTIGAPKPFEEEITAGANGSLLLLARGAPLRTPRGDRVGALVVLNDTSRVHRLEQVRREFIANVSHELKTPLTTIAGYAELLHGSLDDRAAAEQQLEMLESQVDRISAIIDDLLALARIESQSEAGAPVLEPVRLCDILHDAIGATRTEAVRASVRVEIECPEHLFVRANPLLLSLSVTNLLRNAIAHSLSGGRILLAARAEGEEAVIKVQDWGCGIAPEHVSRIFEPFYRIDPGRSRRRGGSGLGLALVRQIALAHGGIASVASEPGGGSTFTIRLPAAGEPDE